MGRASEVLFVNPYSLTWSVAVNGEGLKISDSGEDLEGFDPITWISDQEYDTPLYLKGAGETLKEFKTLSLSSSDDFEDEEELHSSGSGRKGSGKYGS